MSRESVVCYLTLTSRFLSIFLPTCCPLLTTLATAMPKKSSLLPSTSPADVQSCHEFRVARSGVPSAEQLAELERLLSLSEVQALRSGVPFPLGAHLRGNGVNFAIFSWHATGVRLDLFDYPEDAMPVRSIIFNATWNKTGDIWHVWLEGIQPGRVIRPSAIPGSPLLSTSFTFVAILSIPALRPDSRGRIVA
jgi:hypothetical protein